ncbi:MAG: response regulator [Planctomycetaceae bacterium]|nr:response regulator [Planctomycetaceae bacterium]
MHEIKLLFVDDEVNILRSVVRLLRQCEYTVMTASTGEEALALLHEHEFAAVISDQRMPGLEGTELLERVHRIQPAAVRMILTGYADIDAAMDAINRGAVYRFLTKPWDDEQFRLTIAHAVEQFRLVEQNRLLQVLTECQNEELRLLNEGLETRVQERTREVSELSSRLDATLRGALAVLAQLIESSSSTLGNHSRRVADTAVRMGKQLQMSDESMRQLEVAALLHDIGKLQLPPALLRSERNRLSEEEQILWKRHPADGEAIIRAIPNLEEASSCVRHHHERLNGSGYPDGLRGEQIPLGAQVVALADAFDKELNSRNAFTSRTSSEAISTLRRRANEWFDVHLLDVLEIVVNEQRDAGSHPDLVLEINADDLKPGMILAQEVRTDSGALLLSTETELTGDAIHRLRKFPSIATRSGIRVYRRKEHVAPV